MFTLDIENDDQIDELMLHPYLNTSVIVNTLVRTIRVAAKHQNDHNTKLATRAREILAGETVDVVVQQLNAAAKRDKQTGSWL